MSDGGPPERRGETWEPTPEERWLVSRVTERVGQAQRSGARRQLERAWYENVLFVNGDQWIAFEGSSRRWVAQEAPRWVPQPVTNEIYPRRQRLIAQLLRRRPSARVRPDSNDAADREAARAAEYLLAHADDVVGEERLRQKAATVAVDTGTVYSMEWFNPNAGPEVTVPELEVIPVPQTQAVATCPTCGADTDAAAAGTACPHCGQGLLTPAERTATMPDGSPITTTETRPAIDPATGEPIVRRFRLGELESEMLLPFEVVLDENADCLERAEWWASITYWDLERITRTFPDMAKYVGEDQGTDLLSYYRTALLQLGPASKFRTSALGAPLKGGAVVLCYEERPSAYFPQGMHLIVANGVLLHAGELPIRDQRTNQAELSLTLFQYDQMPGRAAGATPIDHMKPIQRRLNAIDAHVLLNMKTMANPVILAPTQAGLSPGGIEYRPGAVIEYNSLAVGTAPQIVPGVGLPAQVMEVRRACLDALDRIPGTEDAMMGDAPRGVKSGVALAQLGEAGETTHQPRMLRWEAFIAARARKRLLLIQQHYTEPRQVKVLGGGSLWQVRQLQGADIIGNTDVTVEAGSSLPRSRTAQIQLMLDLLEAGILGNPAQDERLRQRILTEVGFTDLETDLAPDRRMALTENAMMDAGQRPAVGQYENKLAHLAEHLAEVKDPAFLSKPPEVQALYHEHVSQTRALLVQELQVEAQAGTLPGAPPPVPAGGPPTAAPQPPDGEESVGGGAAPTNVDEVGNARQPEAA